MISDSPVLNKSPLGKMMASDDKKIKTNSTPENEAPPEKKRPSGAEPSKADSGELAAASPSGYSRGEGQKPVSEAYRDNWNVIFAKKKAGHPPLILNRISKGSCKTHGKRPRI
jgi:hypothetical protein